MNTTPHAILKKFYLRKKRANPLYSLRSIAVTMDMNSSFVTRIFNGSKKIPKDRLDKLISVLEIDALGVKELKKALLFEYAQEIECPIDDVLQGSLTHFEEYKVDPSEDGLFHSWHRVALLELTDLPHFKWNLKLWCQKLNVNEEDLQKSWDFLVLNNYVTENALGKWQKVDEKIRIATGKSQNSIRRFHKDVMSKAVQEMYQFTDQASFEKRYITGATITISPSQIEKVRIRMQEMILELVNLANQGPQQNLYAINFAFFPLTKDL